MMVSEVKAWRNCGTNLATRCGPVVALPSWEWKCSSTLSMIESENWIANVCAPLEVSAEICARKPRCVHYR